MVRYRSVSGPKFKVYKPYNVEFYKVKIMWDSDSVFLEIGTGKHPTGSGTLLKRIDNPAKMNTYIHMSITSLGTTKYFSISNIKVFVFRKKTYKMVKGRRFVLKHHFDGLPKVIKLY